MTLDEFTKHVLSIDSRIDIKSIKAEYESFKSIGSLWFGLCPSVESRKRHSIKCDDVDTCRQCWTMVFNSEVESKTYWRVR